MKKLLFVVAVLAMSCTKVYNQLPNQPTPVPTEPKVVRDTIEFRVNGNPALVRIRYSDGLDGLNQTTSVLPFQTAFTSTREFVFLSLEASPLSYPAAVTIPFLNVQIYVNGILFREASSSDFTTNPVIASGTYRR